MATDVTLPQLGESVTEGTVTRWLKQVGDSVQLDEPLLEVSTDKVDTEIPSPVAGTVLEIRADEDETIEVGAVLALVGDSSQASDGGSGDADSGSDSDSADSGAPEEAASDDGGSEAAADFDDVADESGADQTESEPIGAPAQDTAQEQQPDDVSQQPESVSQQPAPPEEDPTPEASPEPQSQQQAAPAQQSTEQPTASGSGGHAATSSGDAQSYVTPLVRKLAAQHDVDLSGLEGTGVGGRIRKQDVLAAAEAAKKAAEPEAATPAAQPASAPSPSADVAALRGTTKKMSRLRQTIAKRMVESLQTSAQLTTVVEIDVTGIARLRSRVKDQFAAREGVKLSFMPFFAKAAVEALKTFPQVNATIDADTLEVMYHDTENLAIAVDTERGLLTPVIKEAGDLSIAGLARRIADVAERTRNNKITPDDLFGGTFTLTNTGSRGALFDTPIINMPQVAILGTGSVVKRPVVIDDANLGETIAIRQMVYFSLTYDHRLVDGADAARFLSALKARLEEAAFEGDLGV